jgi:hypothetical protein
VAEQIGGAQLKKERIEIKLFTFSCMFSVVPGYFVKYVLCIFIFLVVYAVIQVIEIRSLIQIKLF